MLGARLAETEARAGRQRVAAIEVETLRSKTEALETNKRLLEAAVDDLRAEVEAYTQVDEKKNPRKRSSPSTAARICKRRSTPPDPSNGRRRPSQNSPAKLRHRLATGIEGRTLYYSDRDSRCFLGGLATTRRTRSAPGD